MAISFKKYVDIVSGVGGAALVPTRELIGRLFTTNPLVPTKSFYEFTDLASVGDYFGTQSEEYLRAIFYFGWVSKAITSPKKISFARWADAATAPQIFGDPDEFQLASFTGTSDGAITLTLGVDTEVITGIDFTPDLTLADVAATLQAAVRAANAGAQWTGATVTYNVTRKSFDLTGGATGPAVISVANAGSGTEIMSLIGWDNAILSDGVAIESVTDVLTESAGANNNFGSFLFMPALSIDEVVEAATWTKNQNVMFQFYHSVLEVDASDYYEVLKDIAGTGITIKPATVADEYHEMMPMMVLAATDYKKRNSNQNYMFQTFPVSATVTSTSDSNTLDSQRMNYYGETQSAGASLRFYQRGLLMGLSSDPLDMNTYANEQWLKDANFASIMNLLLAMPAIQANDTGRSQILGILQDNIDQAKFNGVISIDKPMTPTQQAYITSVTGDENAWRQVQSIGYWLDAVVNEGSPGEFSIDYTLIYAKADAVRKVNGTQIMI